MYLSNSIGGKAYKDLNDAVSNIKTEKGMTELYRFDAKKYAVVFYKNDEQIISYEFLNRMDAIIHMAAGRLYMIMMTGIQH